MVTQTAHIIYCFLTNILFKLFCKVIDIACIHQILPYNQTILITQIIKCIRWIITAAPYTKHVIISFYRRSDQCLYAFLRDPWIDAVLWNIISSHWENMNTIYYKCKFISPLILLCADCKFTKTNRIFLWIKHELIVIHQRYLHLIQWLIPKPIAPPKLWLRYQNFCTDCFFYCRQNDLL